MVGFFIITKLYKIRTIARKENYHAWGIGLPPQIGRDWSGCYAQITRPNADTVILHRVYKETITFPKVKKEKKE